MKNTILLILSFFLISSCAQKKSEQTNGQVAPESLKEAYAGAFKLGSAVNGLVISERDTAARNIITSQFNTITPENSM